MSGSRPTQVQESEGPRGTGKRRLLFWLVVTVAANAVFDVVVSLPYDDLGFAIFATTGLAAFFAFAWVLLDARERSLDLRPWGTAVALLTKLALPVYFVVSRGWRQGLLASLATVVFLAALLGVYIGVAQLTAALWALFS
jgi:hypothetical protein